MPGKPAPKLDKSKPHGTVIGPLGVIGFTQDDVDFDTQGKVIEAPKEETTEEE